MFNIYYINFPKVYELKMMLSNIVSISKEIQSDTSKDTAYDFRGKLGIKFLNMFDTELGASRNSKNSNSNKVLETFEIKTTKSLILSEILNNSKESNSFQGVNEGDLIRVDGVKLALENEAELRMVKVFMSGNMKGLIPDTNGLDVSSLVNSLVKDYAYKLKGFINSDGKHILMKIPLTFESEFESSYGIDDLFIGKVGVVGLYKGLVKMKSLRNSFEFFQEIGSQSKNNNDDLEISASQETDSDNDNTLFKTNNLDDQDYHYIDLLSIYQNIKLPGKVS